MEERPWSSHGWMDLHAATRVPARGRSTALPALSFPSHQREMRLCACVRECARERENVFPCVPRVLTLGCWVCCMRREGRVCMVELRVQEGTEGVHVRARVRLCVRVWRKKGGESQVLRRGEAVEKAMKGETGK